MKEINEKSMSQQITAFESLYHDLVLYAKAMEELERRKAENLKVLRTYGFDV